MGVIHKLKPEIIEFVVEQKKLDKNLSCRKIAALVQDKFKFKLSKSSANAILKQAGLSMPAGRRQRPGVKKAPSELKQALPEKKTLPQLKQALPELKHAPEQLKKIPPAEKPVAPAPIRCIKINLSDGSSFYLDGRMHTVWHSATQIPEAFSTTMKTKGDGSLREPSPFADPIVLFFACGYDSPTEELFKFILSFESPQSKVSQLTLYDNELREVEKIDASLFPRHFVFGIWPWQFKDYIKVRVSEEFTPLNREGSLSQKIEPSPFYIAEAEVELTSPEKELPIVKLRGAALYQTGTVLAEDHPFVLLSNFTSQDMPAGELAALYLKRWPDLEAALRDFTRKIEEFRKRFL